MFMSHYATEVCKCPSLDLGDGWLLITHSNTKMKKAFIEKVSEALGLGLEVTIIK